MGPREPLRVQQIPMQSIATQRNPSGADRCYVDHTVRHGTHRMGNPMDIMYTQDIYGGGEGIQSGAMHTDTSHAMHTMHHRAYGAPVARG